MAISSNIKPRSGKGLAGDARELARRVGSPGDLAELSFVLEVPGTPAVVDMISLRGFLVNYVKSVLIPMELPAVCQAFEHASRGAIAELITLDQSHVPAGLPRAMAEASQMVGRTHLRRMRPLRGERRVQRYWRAVQRGEAHAWHTVVYGLVLAVYALPLRQGLLSFGCQTIRGFVSSTDKRLRLDAAECEALERELASLLAPAVEVLLAGSSGPRLLAI
jgi:urease accessory protein UreF